MKSLLYLGMFFFFLCGYATAQSLIRDSCMKVKHLAGFNTGVCIKSLEENPKGRSAKTVNELIVVSARNALAKITTATAMFHKIPPGDETPPQNCFKLYTNASNSINIGLVLIATKKFKAGTAAMEVAYRAREKCTGGLHKMTPQLYDDIAALHRIVYIPYAFSSLLK